MNPEQTLTPTTQDHLLLGKILIKLTATSKILSAILVVVIVLAWYDLLNRLLAFGKGIDYTGNHFMGADASALLQRYNPYFWWALIILCTILILYLLTLAVRAMADRVRLKLVDDGSVTQMTDRLSAPALDVLLWAWRERDEPLRVADLQLASRALRAGRARRLQQAALQLATLEDARARKSLPSA
ncbi:MAG TPA: hypothetical protein VF285_07835 [Castellaniella sp.]|uniref:hypothetical protein n=1 Tax=Castellaniella sp. TaxID=1955812 RepID=UPI002F165A52